MGDRPLSAPRSDGADACHPRRGRARLRRAEEPPLGAPPALPVAEHELTARWLAGVRHPLRLEDGRILRVIFPGIAGGGAGPDVRDALLELDGDLVRGDVECHLRASGWAAHGHTGDPAYAAVVLHVVARNDSASAATRHGGGRAIPIAVLAAVEAGLPGEGFLPPCTLRAAAAPAEVAAALERLGRRRLRLKAARAAPLVASTGPGQALYQLLLETLAGPANRPAFAALARRLPLAALLERAAEAPPAAARPLALAAALRGDARLVALRRAGLRPLAAPARRIEVAAALVARLWPAAAPAGWPALTPGDLPAALRVPGAGRAAAIELSVNAVLPVALAAGLWPEAEAEDLYARLPSPGTYGRLRRLEGWLRGGDAAARPFAGARALQSGLLLHADYCARGACGRCPLSGDRAAGAR